MKYSILSILVFSFFVLGSFSLVIPRRVTKDIIITENAILEGETSLSAKLHFEKGVTLDMNGFGIRLGYRSRVIFNGTSNQKIIVNANGGGFYSTAFSGLGITIRNTKFINLFVIRSHSLISISNSEFTSDKRNKLSISAPLDINKSLFKKLSVFSITHKFNVVTVSESRFEDIGEINQGISLDLNFDKCKFKDIKKIKIQHIKNSIIDSVEGVITMVLNGTVIKNSGIQGEALCSCDDNIFEFGLECIINKCMFENNKGDTIINAVSSKRNRPEYINFSTFKNNKASDSIISSELGIAIKNRFKGNHAKYLYTTTLKKKDINAKYNYWDSVSPREISSKIYDKKQNPNLGNVIFEPFLNK